MDTHTLAASREWTERDEEMFLKVREDKLIAMLQSMIRAEDDPGMVELFEEMITDLVAQARRKRWPSAAVGVEN